jgi:alpha-glucosidase
MLLTVKGTPFIYYGEEIGMRDIPIRKKSDIKDPIGKTFWPFYKGRDGCRAPMQWTDEVNAGFSKTEPWLPVNENFLKRNAQKLAEDPESILNFMKKIIAIRKNETALQRGDFISLVSDPKHILAYIRKYQDDQILVVLNFSSRELTYDIPKGSWISLLEDETDPEKQLIIMPYQVHILKHSG